MIWSCQDKDPSAGPSFRLVFGQALQGIFPDVPEPHRAVDEPPAGWKAAPKHQLELEGSGKAGLGGTQRQGQDRWQSGRLDDGLVMVGWKMLEGEGWACSKICQEVGPYWAQSSKKKWVGWTFPSTDCFETVFDFSFPAWDEDDDPQSFQSFNWATWNHVEPPWSYNDLLRTVGSPNWHCRTLWTVVRSILRTTTGPPNSPWSLVRCASTPGMAHHLPPLHWAWPKNWDFFGCFSPRVGAEVSETC